MRRWLNLSAVMVVTFAASCSDAPLAPREPAWVTVATFPAEAGPVTAIAASTSTVATTLGRSSDDPCAIWRYSNGALAMEYQTGGDTDVLAAVDVLRSDTAYAVGGTGDQYRPDPLILRYFARDEYWERVAIAGLPGGVLVSVKITGEDEGWVTAVDYYEYHDRPEGGTLAKFKGSAAQAFPALGPVTFAWAQGPPSPGTAYAVEYAGPHGQYEPGADARVFVSEDGGASWAEERLPAHAIAGHEIRAARAATTRDGDLYIIAELDAGHYYALIQRTGAPGEGAYAPVFFAHTGPYLLELRDFAFKGSNSPYGISCDGVGVGVQSSIVYNEGNFYLEKLPFPMDIFAVCPTEDPGFVAFGFDNTFGCYRLLYHP